VSYEFKLPDLGEGLTEGEIARWLVSEGQEIAEDDPLVEIATDKTTVEIPSPAGGTVSKILVGEGEVVPVGTVLVVIGGNGRPVSDTTQPVSDARVRATPLVRRLADQLGVDLERVTGSGPQGRITEQDVRGATEPREGRREPMRGIKRQMFEHLTRAHAVPTITWVEECDFTGVDLKLLVPLVLKACAESLKEYPELNARVEDHDLVYLDRYDIGVAVQTERGLVVPVVRGCDTRSVEELDADVRRLADGAHEGTLAPEDLRGGTFTITSAGRSAGLFTTTLLNHPEVAILGVHRIGERAVVRDGETDVRRMGNISVTFDHRVIDGKRAAEFGLSVIARLRDRSGAA
jgi:pyruvate/2-oxoglutarate dehydrogenase complex dihydrolipoamide acyltransferase (E2) component